MQFPIFHAITQERPMNHPSPKINTFGLRILIFVFLLWASLPPAQVHSQNTAPKNGWSHVKYAMYFTYTDIENLLVDSAQFAKTIAYFAPVNHTKCIWKETARRTSMSRL